MSRKMMSRRGFLALSSTVSASALAACVAPAAPAAPEATAVPAATEAPAPTAVPAATEAPAAARTEVRCFMGGYTPTEWTSRSAEHPQVVNAPRILAQRFEEANPTIQIVFEEGPGGEDYFAWLTAAASAGTAPDMVESTHNFAVQNGWAMPLDDFLDLPNPYAPQYGAWRDIFYPSFMKSLIQPDGKVYTAPLDCIWPNVEVGLAYNKETLARLGAKPQATWREQMDLAKALKESGDGFAPWQGEAASGSLWPLALQILPSMMQSILPEMDLNKDKFIGIEEALPAYKSGLIGPNTPIYRRAFAEMRELASYWIEGFNTTDIDLLWREGKIGLRYAGSWEWSQMANDPNITFERGFLPPPLPNSSDMPATTSQPGAFDPPRTTAGDGSVPGELLTAIQGSEWAIMAASVEKRNNRDEAINWWQFLTAPENNAFLANENQARISSAVDAPLGSIWQEIAQFKLPLYDYAVAWWGQGWYWDNDNFNKWRPIFVEWMTGQIDEATFFKRQEEEFAAGAARYEVVLKETATATATPKP